MDFCHRKTNGYTMNLCYKLYLLLLLLCAPSWLISQSYYGQVAHPPWNDMEISEVIYDLLSCECNSCCSNNIIGTTVHDYGSGLTMSPEGELYSLSASGIRFIDQTTGASSLIFNLPLLSLHNYDSLLHQLS